MRNVLVVDIAAEVGGALTILESFYYAAKTQLNTQWFFLVSKPFYEETENVKVLRYPWTKKLKIYRLFFDLFFIPHLIRKYRIDSVLSLQNHSVFTNKPQMVYLHQSIPFSDYKFYFRKDPSLWFIQNVLKKSILFSVRKADRVIVQSQWMKNGCVRAAGIREDKILVISPEVSLEGIRPYRLGGKPNRRFFYPAIAREYKNHQLIISACVLLEQDGIRDYEVEFTVLPDENHHAKALYQSVSDKNLNIQFIGRIYREKMSDYYENHVLLFPSLLETVGLPLKEAKKASSIILAADCAYAHEALTDYKNAFFVKNDPQELAAYMKACIDGTIQYSTKPAVQGDDIPSWEPLFMEIAAL